MVRQLQKFVTLIVTLLCASGAIAAAETTPCSELSRYFASNQDSKLPNPTRSPSETERRLVEKSRLELLEWTDYAMGTLIVDADNDGKEDLLAWNIQGSGRFVSAEVFSLPSRQAGNANKLLRKASLALGVLHEPRFVRFKGINYLVSTDTGDAEGISLGRIARVAGDRYEQQTICVMQTKIKPETNCRHPACKKLKELIENTEKNAPLVNVEWPHTYVAPAGLEVFYSGDWSDGDFDNTNNPTSIWRIGREGYINQHIYWALLGQGAEEPQVDPKLRPLSEDKTERRVLPGPQHNRLRRTLMEQSEVLSQTLNRPISLPNEGEFFMFKANENRTYWAWDFGDPPYGQEINILYTNAKRSDYIGKVKVIRNLVLEPCKSSCNTSLDQ